MNRVKTIALCGKCAETSLRDHASADRPRGPHRRVRSRRHSCRRSRDGRRVHRRPRHAQAAAAGHVDLQRRQHRLAEPDRPERLRAAGGAPRLAGPGRAATDERRVRAGQADRRHVLAVVARAVVAVADRHPGRRPRLRPARLHGQRGARAQPGTARLVQPVPGRQPRRPQQAAGEPPRSPQPELALRLRRQALLQPRPARRPRLHPRRDHGRRHPLRPRRRAPRRLLLPLSRRRPDHPRRRRLRRARRRLRQRARLAPRERQPPRTRARPAHPHRQALGLLRRQPVRHLAQRRHRPARLAHLRPAVLRRHLRRHPPLGEAGLGGLHRTAALLVHRVRPGRLRGAHRLVGGRGQGHRRPAPHRPGRLPRGRERPGPRLAGPRRAQRPPVRQQAAPRSGRRHLLQRQGRQGRPDQLLLHPGERPLHQARAAARPRHVRRARRPRDHLGHPRLRRRRPRLAGRVAPPPTPSTG